MSVTTFVVVLLGAALLLLMPLRSFAAGTTLGNTAVGTYTDTYESNDLTASMFTTDAAGGLTASVSVYVGAVDAAPNNQFQAAIYTNGANDAPDQLVASSASATLVGNAWNQVALGTTLAPNTSYWIVYNTNGGSRAYNNMTYDVAGRGAFSAPVTFGTWPSTFGSAATGTWNFSIYLTYASGNVTPTPTPSVTPPPPTPTPPPPTPTPPPPTPSPTPLPATGPGGPVLIITSSSDAFTQYYGDILTAEGLNYYKMMDVSALTPQVLVNYDVAILGSMPVTANQVSLLTNWVNAGGQLIAMRPDAKLDGLLGLTSTGQTLSEGWLQIGSSDPATAGITHAVIQYHGTADRYALNGATAIANLFTNISTPAGAPAVTVRSVGSSGGHAAAFTYDLARSIILTRQGNPAWAGQNRDGVDAIETGDLFYGNASYDPQPNWNNLSQNGLIPIADEQQRLLANMVTTLDVLKPLPRFWYLPFDKPAAVVMTGDDHGRGGTSGRFEQEIADSPANCSLADWTCVRSTSNIYPNSISEADAVNFVNQGFEITDHLTNQCQPWGTPANWDATVADELQKFHQFYPDVPAQVTNRTHCVEWDDWSTAAKVEAKYGIRLDTNYYYYPSVFTQGQPAYFNGTGEVMPFADLDGTKIDVYQATTLLTDESALDVPSAIVTLLDQATGPQQFYATIVANMHTDKAVSPGSDAIIAAAQARGIPIISAKQLLTWLDGRNNSSVADMHWAGNVFSFTVNAASGSHGMTMILPLSTLPNATLSSITTGATTVAYTTQLIKGIDYAVFPVQQGTYEATFGGQIPTPAPAPGKVLGTNTVGTMQDRGDVNNMNGSAFTMGESNATVTKISVYVGPVDIAPNNQYQVAVYTDDNGQPGTLLVQSGTGTLTAYAWNSISVPTTILAGGARYWLMFNTNGNSVNMWFADGDPLQTAWGEGGQAFGTWPTQFPRPLYASVQFSIYAGN